MENELIIRLKQIMFQAYMGGLKTQGPEEAIKISDQFSELIKDIPNIEIQKSIAELVESVFLEGYKLGLSVSPTANLSFDRIIFRMNDKGLESDIIAEYLGISENRVKQVLNSK